MNICPVHRDDLTAIFEMLQSISNFYPKPNEYEKIWDSFLSQDHVFGFSFFIENEIVGYGAVVFEVKIRGGKMAHIEDIVVSEHHRSKGIGSKIIDFLEQEAKQKGCYKISLSCKTKNILFYENCGFTSDGHTMTKIL